jgi:DNA-binding response OmpR family regulator
MNSGGHDAMVMIVEDDATIGTVLRDALMANGYRCELHANGSDARSAFLAASPDLILLDAGLPDIDGFTLCRWFRTQSREVPIIMVTARDAEIDVIVGLDAGANDYVTKPFATGILLARVRAHLRDSAPPDEDGPIAIGSLLIDPRSYQVTAGDTSVDLRLREFQLLLYLVREAGRVVSRERLLADVWDLHWESATKTLDMHVLALRRKLHGAIEISTVRGIGYRLETGP